MDNNGMMRLVAAVIEQAKKDYRNQYCERAKIERFLRETPLLDIIDVDREGVVEAFRDSISKGRKCKYGKS